MSESRLKVNKDDVLSVSDELMVARLYITGNPPFIFCDQSTFTIFLNIVGDGKNYDTFSSTQLGYNVYIKLLHPADQRKMINSTGVLLVVPPYTDTVELRGVDTLFGYPSVIEINSVEVPHFGEFQFLFVIIENEITDGYFHMTWEQDGNEENSMILEYCFYESKKSYWADKSKNMR